MTASARLHDALRRLELQPYLDALPVRDLTLEQHRCESHVPGVSVAVLTRAGEVLQAVSGVRRTGLAVEPDTRFQAASISKAVTALAVLRLVAEGVLDLDEDVHTYLRRWRVPENDDWKPRLTLRHLLTHTGGTTISGFPGYPPGIPVPSLVEVLSGSGPANTEPVHVTALPGVQSRYSGGGSTIVQCVLEDVRGTPFDEMLRELVLEPLEMRHSTFAQPLPERERHAAASGHRGVWGGRSEVKGGAHTYPEQAAAGLWTTPSDLTCVIRAVASSAAGSPNAFLPVRLVDEMLSVHVPPFGLGFMVERGTHDTCFHHDGSNAGFTCDLRGFVGSHEGVIVMTNSDDGVKVIRPLVSAVAREFGWTNLLPRTPSTVSPAPLELTTVEGTYEFEEDFALVVRVRGHALEVRATGQPPLQFERAADGSFFSQQVNTRLAFVVDASSSASVRLRQHGF
jgi:CubicO group peptidase (beta-lactamase class C family)